MNATYIAETFPYGEESSVSEYLFWGEIRLILVTFTGYFPAN